MANNDTLDVEENQEENHENQEIADDIGAVEGTEDSGTQLQQLSQDYSQYLQFDVSFEKSKFIDTVEEMLTKLDEFRGLIDMVRSDTSLCLYRTLPEIQSKCKEMELIFDKIDKLETFVAMVKQNVGEMEEVVNKAEEEMGTFSGIRKMWSNVSLSPFKSRKPPAPKPTSKVVFNSPDIFETETFFPSNAASTISVLKVDATGQELNNT